MPKNNKKRIFEDVSGHNTIFLSEVKYPIGMPSSEIAIIVSDDNDKEVSVTMLSKSDIPRFIRELTKLL